MSFCEDLTVTIRQTTDGGDSASDISFQIAAGKLTVLAAPLESPNLTIEIPAGILNRIVTQNLSWDEAHIGYWCRFSRQPDIFHANFWRLLQAPYFAKPAALKRANHQTPGPITSNWIKADLIEKFGESADRIIRRYGLTAPGCHHSTADTIAHGARQHGLDEPHLQRLLTELNHSLPVQSDT